MIFNNINRDGCIFRDYISGEASSKLLGASKLIQESASEDMIPIQAFTHFVTPLAYQSVIECRVYIAGKLWDGKGHVMHIGLVRKVDLLIFAPNPDNKSVTL